MGQCECFENRYVTLVPENPYESIQQFVSLPMPQDEYIDDYSTEIHVPKHGAIDYTLPLIPRLRLEQPLCDAMLPHSDQAFRLDNFIYIGQWKHQQPFGLGLFIYDDGTIYDGLSLNQAPHIYGKKYYPDGSIYEGEFKDGMQHGNGEFEGKGRRFTGIWKDNYPYQGSEELPEEIYSGYFHYGLRHGLGALKRENDFYEGEFYKGMFHGKGKYQQTNGDIYEGEFKFNIKDGYGRLIHSNGIVKEGLFQDGVFIG